MLGWGEGGEGELVVPTYRQQEIAMVRRSATELQTRRGARLCASRSDFARCYEPEKPIDAHDDSECQHRRPTGL